MKTIAETAWHHEGDFNFMFDLVDKIIRESLADIIKLHLSLDYEEYFSNNHPAYKIIKEKNLSKEQWEKVINLIRESDKELMLLYNDTKAIEFGMQFNPCLIEIHSVCLNDIYLLKKIKSHKIKNIPIVLSVGGSTLYEIENAIEYLETDNIILMHGFQNYPTNYRDINFKRIRKIINLYPGLKHGYADHTAWNEPNNILITTMGAVLGIDYIEKHITIDPGSNRTDWEAAISIEDFNTIAQNLQILCDCEGDGRLKLNEGEKEYSTFGPNKKAAVLKKNVKKGEIFNERVFSFKRTGETTDLSQIHAIEKLGKYFTSDLKKGHCIKISDLE